MFQPERSPGTRAGQGSPPAPSPAGRKNLREQRAEPLGSPPAPAGHSQTLFVDTPKPGPPSGSQPSGVPGRGKGLRSTLQPFLPFETGWGASERSRGPACRGSALRTPKPAGHRAPHREGLWGGWTPQRASILSRAGTPTRMQPGAQVAVMTSTWAPRVCEHGRRKGLPYTRPIEWENIPNAKLPGTDRHPARQRWP